MKAFPLCYSAYPNQQTNFPTDGKQLFERQELEPGTANLAVTSCSTARGHSSLSPAKYSLTVQCFSHPQRDDPVPTWQFTNMAFGCIYVPVD
jgi:hypothetical protein